MKVRYPSEHECFDFDSWGEIENKLDDLGLWLPYSKDMSGFAEMYEMGSLTIPNRLAIHPMKGFDGEEDGSPGRLTARRYRRFAGGGAGLIWLEATAIVSEGRANPRQLWLHEENVNEFEELRQLMREAAERDFSGDQPVIVAQLTHSGRRSKPEGNPDPVIVYHHPILDDQTDIPSDYPVISDEELDELQDDYVNAARLARDAGYDAVDVKACHGYLMAQLLNAFTRENSRYGGIYRNRTRMLRQVIQRIREEVPEIAVMCRLSIYDAIPYPYGFGMGSDGSMEPDLSEPIHLVREMKEWGVSMVNVAYGNPYYNPHVERPYDSKEQDGYIPNEHPLANIANSVELHRKLAEEVPDMPLVATGFSWLRELSPYVGAALIEKKDAASVGYGRQALACPQFARHILENGELDSSSVCITCSSCTDILRQGGRAGCVVRDTGVYGPIYERCHTETEHDV